MDEYDDYPVVYAERWIANYVVLVIPDDCGELKPYSHGGEYGWVILRDGERKRAGGCGHLSVDDALEEGIEELEEGLNGWR